MAPFAIVPENGCGGKVNNGGAKVATTKFASVLCLTEDTRYSVPSPSNTAKRRRVNRRIKGCLNLKKWYHYNMNEYAITLFWDEEASVWIAESPDVPGLILESHSFDELIEKVKTAVPDLLEINGTKLHGVKLHFKAEHLAVVA